MFAPLISIVIHRARAAILALALFAVAGIGHAGEVQRYGFDPVHSQVVFFVGHQGYSQAIGRVRLGPGHFRFDEDDWSRSTLDVVVDLDSLDMGDAKWTDAVKASQLLDVGRYPQARFVSRSVEQVEGNRGVIRGDLNLHGNIVPLELAIAFNKAARDPYSFKDKVGFSARAMLKRGDFGIKRYQGVVGEEVELRIEVEGVPEDNPVEREEGNDGNQE